MRGWRSLRWSVLPLALTACFVNSSYNQVDIAGSAIVLADDNVPVGGKAQVRFVVRQGNLQPVAGLTVFVQGDTCAPTTPAVTDAHGRAQVTVSGCPAGEQALRSGFVRRDLRYNFGVVRYVNIYDSPDGASVRVGTPLTVSSRVPDAAGDPLPAASEVLHFVSSDPQATLPAAPALGPGSFGQAQSRLGLVLRSPGSQSVSLADAAGHVLGTTTFEVLADDRATLELRLPQQPIVAGVPFGVQLAAQDADGAVQATFAGSVVASSDDPNAVLPAWGAFIGGVANASGLVLYRAGPTHITVQSGGRTAQATAQVQAAPAASLQVAVAGQPTAGVLAQLVVTARDAFGNLAASYAGTLAVTTSDPRAVLPVGFSFAASAAASVAFNASWLSAGPQTLTVRDIAQPTLQSAPLGVTVTPAAPSALRLAIDPNQAVAAVPVTWAQLEVRDPFDNLVTTYTGQAALTSSDPNADLPTSVAQASGSVSTGPMTFAHSGTVFVTATDVAGRLRGDEKALRVAPGTLARLQVSGPTAAVTSSAVHFDIAGSDPLGNRIAGSGPAVTVTCGDAAATCPAPVTLMNGDSGFDVTFANVGTFDIAVTAGSVTSAPHAVAISGAPRRLAVTLPATMTAGVPGALGVRALDANGQLATSATHRVGFVSSDPAPTLPTSLVLSNGQASLPTGATFTRAGAQTLTAFDAGGALAQGSTATAVVAGAATQLTVSNTTNPASRQQPASFRVTALDPYGNVDTQYTGTVHFTANDPNATLPADVTFAPADAGSRRISPGVRLRRLGPASLTATDVAQGFSGNQNDITVHQGVAVTSAQEGISLCVRFNDGLVKCWGVNVPLLNNWSGGLLGYGDTQNRGFGPGQMGEALPYVDLGAGRTAMQMGGGNRLSQCALLDTGAVKCWGDNTFGQLGLGDTTWRGGNPNQMGDSLPAVDLGTGRTAVRIGNVGGNVTARAWTCAVLDTGALKCWGDNSLGQLGLGDSVSRGKGAGTMGDALPAVNLGAGRTATSVVTNCGNTCAVLDDRSVKCWGSNTSAGNCVAGSLGLGDTISRGSAASHMGDNLPAVNLGSSFVVDSLCAQSYAVCAQSVAGAVKCWGYNAFGELGLGDTSNRGNSASHMGNSLPAASLGTGRTAKQIACGTFHACALLDDGSVKCWGGRSTEPVLGIGDVASRGTSPGQMGDALPAVSLGTGRSATWVGAAGYTTCAVLDDGQAKCWGSNSNSVNTGLLGVGDSMDRGGSPGQMGDSLPAVQW